MKVGPTDTIRYLNQVHEKRDTGDNGQKSGQQHSQQDARNPDENSEVFEVSDEKVGAAIESFRTDAQAQANGLKAQVEGQGPGLKITLKDGSGAVVRQFTGEEFIKLREAASTGRSRGKILDQKV